MIAVDEVHDLNYKMSKKIAQLTKVIYQLNSRNEDNETTVQNVADRYEAEIAEIMSDARKKISSLREQLCAKSDDKKLEFVIKELTLQHQKEKDAAMCTFAEFKAQMLKNEAAAKHNFEERLLEATRELSLAKEEFKATLEDIEKNRNSEVFSAIEKKNKKDEEIDRLVKEYNERYNSMMLHHMEEQGQLEKRLNDEWSTKVKNVETELKKQLELNEERLLMEEQRSSSLLAELEDLRKVHKVIVNENGNLKGELLRLNERLEQLSSGSSELTEALNHVRRQEGSYKDKVAQLESELENAVNELRTLTVLHQNDKDKLSDFELKFTNLNNDTDVLKVEVAKLVQDRDALKEENISMKESNSAIITDMQLKINQLEESLAAVVSQHNDEVSEHTKTVNKLSDVKARNLSLQEELRLSIEKYDKDMADAHQNHKEALRKTLESASGSASDMISKHAEELNKLQRELEQDRDVKLLAQDKKHTEYINDIVKSHADKTTAMEEAFEIKLKVLEEQYKSKVETLRLDNVALKKVAGDMSTVLEDLTKAQEELRREIYTDIVAEKSIFSQRLLEIHEDNKAEMERRLEEMKKLFDSRLVSNTKDSAGKITALEMELENLREKSRADQIEMNEKYAAELAALKRNHNDDMATALSSHVCQDQIEKARHEAELIRLKKELTEKYEEHQRTYDADHCKIVNDLKNLAESYKAAKNDAENRLRYEIESLKQNSHQLHANMSSKVTHLEEMIKRMEQDHLIALHNLREDDSKSMNEALKSLKDEHALTVMSLEMRLHAVKEETDRQILQISADARAAQKDMEESYKNRISSLEKRKDEERERDIRELVSKSEKELERLLQRHDSEVNALQEENRELSLELRDLKATLDSTSKMLTVCKERLDDEQHRVCQLNDLAKKAAEEHQRAYIELKRNIELERDAALESVHRSNQEVVDKLIGDFSSERAEFEKNVKILKTRIADLEYKYANRESRAEDVQRINELLRDLRENENALLKAHSDMKFFKLELHNREESYNKVFGRQPTVAGSGSSAVHKERSSTAETARRKELSLLSNR